MKFSREQIVNLLERFLNDEPCLVELDELISIKHHDKYTKYWSDRLLDVMDKFAAEEDDRFLSDEGVAKVEDILNELKSSDGFQEA